MGTLIRPGTSPRLPLEDSDQAHNEGLAEMWRTMEQARSARTIKQAERALRRLKRKQKNKGTRLPRPYTGGKRRNAVVVPLPHHREART